MKWGKPPRHSSLPRLRGDCNEGFPSGQRRVNDNPEPFASSHSLGIARIPSESARARVASAARVASHIAWCARSALSVSLLPVAVSSSPPREENFLPLLLQLLLNPESNQKRNHPVKDDDVEEFEKAFHNTSLRVENDSAF